MHHVWRIWALLTAGVCLFIYQVSQICICIMNFLYDPNVYVGKEWSVCQGRTVTSCKGGVIYEVSVTELKYDKLWKAWADNCDLDWARLAGATDSDAHSWRSWTCRCRLASGGLASWSGGDVSSAVRNWLSLSCQGLSHLLLFVSQWCHLEKDRNSVNHMRKYSMWIQCFQFDSLQNYNTVLCCVLCITISKCTLVLLYLEYMYTTGKLY